MTIHRLLLWYTLSALCLSVFGQSPVQRMNWPVTNGTVNAIEVDGLTGRVLIGGNFTIVGPNAPFGAVLTYPASAPAPGHERPNARVRAVVPDGSGGWYIGGDFTQVGAQIRNGLAHILPDGTCDGWDPGSNLATAQVFALAMSGGYIYAGGEFTSLDASSSRDLARITLSGTVDSTFPDNAGATGSVRCLATDGTKLYVGGDFTIAGNTNLVSITTAGSGSMDAWSPSPDAMVRAMRVSGGALYVAGDFLQTGASPRNRAAAFDLSMGVLLAWNPDVSAPVHALEADGATVYLGGAFTAVNTGTTNTARSRVAAVDASSGSVLPFNATGGSGTVSALRVQGTDLFIGGAFNNSFGGKYGLAAVSKTTGAHVGWLPQPGGPVDAIAEDGTDLYIAGDFACIGGAARNGLAALDGTTGEPLAWGGTGAAGVNCLHLTGGTLYVGGTFNAVNGLPRSRVAALDAATGALLPWAPPTNNGSVNTITSDNNLLFVGGSFTSVDAQSRANLCALQRSDASLVAGWDCPIVGSVSALALGGTNLFVGGVYSSIDGVTQRAFGAVDAPSGDVLAGWPAVEPGSSVTAIATDGSRVYLGGTFNSVGGFPRSKMAAVNIADLTVDAAWESGAAGSLVPKDMKVSGNTLAVAGQSFASGDIYLRLLSATTGRSLPWTPEFANPLGGFTGCLGLTSATVVVGGQFNGPGSQPARNLVTYDLCTPSDQFADADADGTGSAIPSPTNPRFDCATLSGYVANHTDCDDADPGVLGPPTWYVDTDGDGRGDPSTPLVACGIQVGRVLDNSDCDDQDPDLYPGAPCDDDNPTTVSDTYTAACTCQGGAVDVAARIFLDGPFTGADMNDGLRAAGLVPLTEPYTALNFHPAEPGGGEGTIAPVLSITGPDAIVDWVMLALRDDGPPYARINIRMALLQRDGDIVDVDGTGPVRFSQVPGSYMLEIRHRNHLGIMTALPMPEVPTGTLLSMDFTTPATGCFGTNARKTIGPVMALWAGNTVNNGRLSYTGVSNDRDPILIKVGSTTPNNVVNGYFREDTNLDGSVRYAGAGNDRDRILVNVGSSTPNNVNLEQLP